MSSSSNDSYKEYVKHESVGQAAGQAAKKAFFEAIWDLIQQFANSKTRF